MDAVPNSVSFHDAAHHNVSFHDAAHPGFQVMLAPEFVAAQNGTTDSQVFFDEAGVAQTFGMSAGVPQFFTIIDASMDYGPQDPGLHFVPHIPATTSSPPRLVPAASSPLQLDYELERLHYEEDRVEERARTVCMDHDYDGNPFVDLKFNKAEKKEAEPEVLAITPIRVPGSAVRKEENYSVVDASQHLDEETFLVVDEAREHLGDSENQGSPVLQVIRPLTLQNQEDEPLQYITVPGSGDEESQILYVTSAANQDDDDNDAAINTLQILSEDGNFITISEAPEKPLPARAVYESEVVTCHPSNAFDPDAWTAHIHDSTRIGDYFRGYVLNEADLDILLTLHKNGTRSSWGTRQSPTPGKSAQRLLWKSQYVPFDGIPFINMGSRAIVMECQYGARRKLAAVNNERNFMGVNDAKKRKQGEIDANYIECCPARIYIKKVRKFIDYNIGVREEAKIILKKHTKTKMERYFKEIKNQLTKDLHLAVEDLTLKGEDRWYVQLPTTDAHEFHADAIENQVLSTNLQFCQKKSPLTYVRKAKTFPSTDTDLGCGADDEDEEDEDGAVDGLGGDAGDSAEGHRLDPNVVNKLRECVGVGITSAVAVRKILRVYVERELLPPGPSVNPDRHNLSFYPTIHDLRNHMYQAFKDVATGKLPITCDAGELRRDIDRILHQESAKPQASQPRIMILQEVVDSLSDQRNLRLIKIID